MKSIFGYIVIIGLLGTASCKKYLDKAYKNPNLPTYAQPEVVLQAAISNMHRGVGFDARTIGMITQNFASVVGSNNWERHGYIPSSDVGAETWRTLYWSFGYNLIDMIDSSQITGKFDYIAAAYTLFAWGWTSVADIHGEMPVVQAFEKGRLSFEYDEQNVAYEYAMRYTDSALKYWQLAADMSKPTLAEGDLWFFGGNQVRWKKFTYGMKARLYHRYFFKSNYSADSVIKYTDLAMSTNADDAMIRFNLAFPDVTARCFFGPSRNNVGGFRIGEFPVKLMNGTTYPIVDPRMKFIMKPSDDGVYRGVPCNQTSNFSGTQAVWGFWGTTAANSTAAPGGGVDTGARTYFKNDAKWPIMTYSEMQFLKAEAAFKKGDLNTAYDAYKNGINGHFDMLTQYTGYTPISPADRTAYTTNPAIVPATPAGLTMSLIMCQKYISLWGWGIIENWVDMRRYNYDEVNIYPGYTRLPLTLLYPDNGGKLCERIRPRYNSEYLWNSEALTKIGGFQPNYHTKKVWFTLP